MDALSHLADGFAIALTWQNLGLALLGCFLGTIMGALPGLGPSNGVAILIPLVFTLGLPATPSLILLTSVYYGAMYGGRISSILLNIPGDEPALMTTLDGYPMARKGQAGEALALSGIASFFGAFFATWGLVFLAPQLVKVALLFGTAEYFALFVLAFATLGGLSSRNQAKAALAAGIGLAISMVGVDGQTGVPRFTFGEVHFYDGIDFLVAIVGLFALSEVFIFLEHRGTDQAAGKVALGRIVPPWSMIKSVWGSMSRGTVLGFIAGVLPGAGASLGSFIAYSMEKRVADRNGTFGTGDPRGVAAPETGNNAAAGGALVPMLALGVPGSGTTAVLLAMLLALNIPMVGIFVRVLTIPPNYLMPAVAMISFVGIYGISGSTFDLMVMIAFGVMGWVLRKLDVPLVPIILGVLLGDQMEKNLRRTMTISDGDFWALLASPLSITLWSFAIIGFILPIFAGRYFRPKAADSHAMEGSDPD